MYLARFESKVSVSQYSVVNRNCFAVPHFSFSTTFSKKPFQKRSVPDLSHQVGAEGQFGKYSKQLELKSKYKIF